MVKKTGHASHDLVMQQMETRKNSISLNKDMKEGIDMLLELHEEKRNIGAKERRIKLDLKDKFGVSISAINEVVKSKKKDPEVFRELMMEVQDILQQIGDTQLSFEGMLQDHREAIEGEAVEVEQKAANA